jgi:hypothetical protein
MRDWDKNSTVVGTLNMLVKCHGEPENHNPLYDQGKSTCSLWEIDTDGMRKKMGRIGLLLVSQCQNFEIHHPYYSFY